VVTGHGLGDGQKTGHRLLARGGAQWLPAQLYFYFEAATKTSNRKSVCAALVLGHTCALVFLSFSLLFFS